MMLVLLVIVFFFFKQKTAYEMRISDWSSDVCSSDLLLELLCLYHGVGLHLGHFRIRLVLLRRKLRRVVQVTLCILHARCVEFPADGVICLLRADKLREGRLHDLCQCGSVAVRSEEGRVGNECVSELRSRRVADR